MTHHNCTPNVACERCGKAVYVPAHRVKTFRFCSHDCRFPRVEVACLVCGVLFLVPPSRAKTAKYCSLQCTDEGKRNKAPDFWQSIDMSGGHDACWNWKGWITRSGYGEARLFGQRCPAHRTAYELANGPIPDGLVVMHQCDNRACCNPAHLSLGTHADNMDDMFRKRRNAFGERQGHAKLTEDDVLQIRSLAGTMSLAKIGTRYGVTPQAVHLIVHGKNWRHVTPPPDHREGDPR